MEKYDLVIVGAGPAGLTAAVYAARYKLNTLVIGQLAGGMAAEAYEICNFPSYEKILGFELTQKMVKQVKELGVKIVPREVKKISGKDGNFSVETSKETYSAKKIILATGGKRRKLNVEREEELTGKGIHYCATCDAPFYKNKTVAVVGGSDAALTASLLLSKFAKKVYIIYRKDKFRAEPTWVEEVEENEKIEPIFNSVISKLLGEEKLTGVKINSEKDLKLDGVFVEIGSDPCNKLAEILEVGMTGKCYLKVDKKQQTSIAGIYAAGDVTDNPLKQVVTACGEGAIAADSVYRELI